MAIKEIGGDCTITNSIYKYLSEYHLIYCMQRHLHLTLSLSKKSISSDRGAIIVYL
jgi:hypothetical protein